MIIEDKNRHKHAGKSSQAFLTSEAIIDPLALQKGDRVCDVGCGNGYVSLYAASVVGEDGVVYAVDSDGVAIDLLKEIITQRAIHNITPLREDVTQGLSIEPHSADICLMINVFHGFVTNKELGAVFTNVNLALRDRGRLVLVDFIKGEETPGPPQEIRIGISEAEQILLRYGYGCLKSYSPGPHHYGLIFAKNTL